MPPDRAEPGISFRSGRRDARIEPNCRSQDIRSFAVESDGSLTCEGVFHKVDDGVSDGFRLDSDGNVWTSAGDGVHCIDSRGRLLGKIYVPEVVSNVCFGWRAKHRLFITATTSVYSLALNRNGVQWP